ncbi:UNVERIFIED_CONTAM: hypothetical protein FKN15_025475 [Acipenser sinensis]
MALVHYFRERRHRNARIPSSMVFNTCKDYLGFSDQFLIQRFRMDRQAILELFDLIREDVECTTSRSHALPLETKVTSALKLYASGTFQNTVGEMSGDSGYALKPWLMTTISNTATPPQRKYNKAHCSTRSAIERTFTILRARFRCLDLTVGTLQYSLQRVCQLTAVCCMLHNTAIARRLPVYNETYYTPNDDDGGDEEKQQLDQNLPSGRDIRENLILNVFA